MEETREIKKKTKVKKEKGRKRRGRWILTFKDHSILLKTVENDQRK